MGIKIFLFTGPTWNTKKLEKVALDSCYLDVASYRFQMPPAIVGHVNLNNDNNKKSKNEYFPKEYA